MKTKNIPAHEQRLIDKRNRHLKDDNWGYILLIKLRVLIMYYEYRNPEIIDSENYQRAMTWRIERFNPFNPLTWLFFMLTTIFSVVGGALIALKVSCSEISRSFKAQRWG